MAKSPEELLALRFGDSSVAENLQRAIDQGRLIETPDGKWKMREPVQPGNEWLTVSVTTLPKCGFNMGFLFATAYAGSAVPHACSACYKVKVSPRTLRQLVAAWKMAQRIECNSKWGVEIDNGYSRDVYAGYFYLTTVDEARALYKVVRQIMDEDPLLGPEVSMKIKRGCSEYEAKLGPSDRYTFSPEMEELEAYLWSRFRRPSGAPDPAPIVHGRWIQAAFRIGDDTYLDFTGGKRLYPQAVDYSPS